MYPLRYFKSCTSHGLTCIYCMGTLDVLQSTLKVFIFSYTGSPVESGLVCLVWFIFSSIHSHM